MQFETGRATGCKYLRDIKADGAVLCIKTFKERNIIYGGTGNKVTVIDWVSSEIKKKMNTSQFGICELIITNDYIIGLGASDSTIRVWGFNDEQEREVKKD